MGYTPRTYRQLCEGRGTDLLKLSEECAKIQTAIDDIGGVGSIDLADGKILLGGEDGFAAAKSVSGDVTITREGATAIGAGKVTPAMLANGAGWAALLAAGLGASANYAKTTSGAQTLLAADADDARVAMIVVTVTEAFADGDGGQPTFTIGETDTATKYAATTVFTDAALGSVFVLAGTLTAVKNLIVTGVAATGTGTGAISVMAMVLPAAA
jgi:hypothetical protein